MGLVEVILEKGKVTFDEGRERKSLQNVVFRIDKPSVSDKIIDRFGDKENVDGIIYLTFKGEEMYDFDVVPSFSPGAKSYYTRLKEGRMIEYVIKRLSEIPESKKGVISFIHWDDYQSVLDTPYDDYLPCMTTIQIRLLEKEKFWNMNVIFHARSLDGYQKANGNLLAVTMIAEKIKKGLNKNLKKSVQMNQITGMITDVHIYKECYKKAQRVLKQYKNEYGY